MSNKASNFHVVYGKHAVSSILQNSKRIVYKLFLLEGLPEPKSINKVKIEYLPKKTLEKMCKDGDKHQGYIAHVSDLLEDLDLDAHLNILSLKDKSGILLLDQINDPHNFGAILRSSYCFGIDLVITTRYNTPSVNSSVIRSSAGMSEFMDIITVTNLNNAISDLKKAGFYIIGLEANADSRELKSIMQENKKIAFAMGNEGVGLRERIKNSCDELVQIKMAPNAESLNVSNASAIVCYEYFCAKQS